MKTPISVLVLTKNEEQNLPVCLNTLRWSDDVHVLDSFSSDRTLEIARSFGAAIAQRPFDSFAAQQNWALRNLPFKYSWIFYIDADERVTPDLEASLAMAVQSPGDKVAFRIRRRDFFMDTWLKHTQASPYYIRLFRPEKMAYERLGHPVSVADGPVGQITGYLDHYPFSKGIREWLDRHNFYSTQEAEQIVANRANQHRFQLRKAFFEADFNQKRFHQKELFYRLPCRPLIKFLLLYIGKRGFLDGQAGLTYSSLMFFYEYMIILKTREAENQENLTDQEAGFGK